MCTFYKYVWGSKVDQTGWLSVLAQLAVACHNGHDTTSQYTSWTRVCTVLGLKNKWPGSDGTKLKKLKQGVEGWHLPLRNVEHVRCDRFLKVSTVHGPQTTQDTEQRTLPTSIWAFRGRSRVAQVKGLTLHHYKPFIRQQGAWLEKCRMQIIYTKRYIIEEPFILKMMQMSYWIVPRIFIKSHSLIILKVMH